MKFKSILLALLFLASKPVYASLVTLQTSWGLGGGTDFLKFTFDDSIQDSNPDPTRGGYFDAIIALDYTSNGVHFGLVESTGSIISVYSPPGPESGYLGPANWIIANVMRDDGTTGQFVMRIESYKYPTTDAIRSIIDITQDDESYVRVDTSSGYLSNITINHGGKMFTEVASVPLPASALLLGSSLIGLIATVRKRKTD